MRLRVWAESSPSKELGIDATELLAHCRSSSASREPSDDGSADSWLSLQSMSLRDEHDPSEEGREERRLLLKFASLSLDMPLKQSGRFVSWFLVWGLGLKV